MTVVAGNQMLFSGRFSLLIRLSNGFPRRSTREGSHGMLSAIDAGHFVGVVVRGGRSVEVHGLLLLVGGLLSSVALFVSSLLAEEIGQAHPRCRFSVSWFIAVSMMTSGVDVDVVDGRLGPSRPVDGFRLATSGVDGLSGRRVDEGLGVSGRLAKPVDRDSDHFGLARVTAADH